MMMGYGFGGGLLGWLGMGFGMIMHLAFTAIVIMGAIWIFNAVFRGGYQADKHTSAVEILKQRYARGEITNDEYQRIKKEIE
ncbi:hypothetical protein SDC9_197809 [bioreactor metagenome]|uniref:SHOCT domain-containing protein n=1 Tax=bioreactor metagenome TaxID=1076179 RepID=A0A645ISJ9_9ZZZZ